MQVVVGGASLGSFTSTGVADGTYKVSGFHQIAFLQVLSNFAEMGIACYNVM